MKGQEGMDAHLEVEVVLLLGTSLCAIVFRGLNFRLFHHLYLHIIGRQTK